MPLEKLWRVFLCTQQLQAGDAGAHEETHWGGDWTGALRAGGGNAVSPRALLPVLLPLTPLPTVNLPYWGGCSWDPLLLAALLLSLTSGVWRLHPLCSVLESNHNTIINGGLVVLSFLFFTLYRNTPSSLSVCPSDHCSSSFHWPKYDTHVTFCLLKKLQRCRYQRALFRFSVQTATDPDNRLPDWSATVWHGLRDVFIVVVQLWCVMLSNLFIHYSVKVNFLFLMGTSDLKSPSRVLVRRCGYLFWRRWSDTNSFIFSLIFFSLFQ